MVISEDPMLSIVVMQERVAAPPTCTVQAPQSATPQPNVPPPCQARRRVRSGASYLAEGAGFEPAMELPPYTLSRRAPSTTRPPLRAAAIYAKPRRSRRCSEPLGTMQRIVRRPSLVAPMLALLA